MTLRTEAVTIRPATALDAVNIARLLKQTLTGDRSASLRVNDDKIVKWVMSTLDTAFVAVADLSGRIVGSIAMSPMQQPWSDDWFMGETWFAVKPSVHTADTDEKLLAKAEEFADTKGLPLFFKVPCEDTEKQDLLATRRGYHFMGESYYRRAHRSRDEQREVSALAT